MIGQPDNYWDEFDERSTIGHLMPLNVQRRKLLLHPVIDTFVMIKYNSYAVLFPTQILMRLAFSLLLTGVILFVDLSFNKRDAGLQGIWATIAEIMAHPSVFWICFSLLVILTLVLLVSKIWLLFEIEGVFIYSITLVYLFLLVTGTNGYDFLNDAIVNFASALLVLLSWINFTASLRFLLLGKHYCLGNYISMLTQVAKKVALFFLLYVPVLVGFTIAFYLTIPDDFDNPIRITKTLAMMIGELDFGDTFGDKDFFRNMLFFAFALAVTVVISNLLIGLTVSDVAELLEKAKMEGMEFKLKQITQMDSSRTMTILSCMLGCCTNSSHMISGQDQLDMEVSKK